MISPGRLDLVMYQGATFTYSLTWTADDEPVDLRGFEARMQVRPSTRSDVVIVEFTDVEGITLGGLEGTVVLSADAETTAGLPSGKYVYDLELDSGGEVTRLIEGSFTIEAEVTR